MFELFATTKYIILFFFTDSKLAENLSSINYKVFYCIIIFCENFDCKTVTLREIYDKSFNDKYREKTFEYNIIISNMISIYQLDLKKLKVVYNLKFKNVTCITNYVLTTYKYYLTYYKKIILI